MLTRTCFSADSSCLRSSWTARASNLESGRQMSTRAILLVAYGLMLAGSAHLHAAERSLVLERADGLVRDAARSHARVAYRIDETLGNAEAFQLSRGSTGSIEVVAGGDAGVLY